MKSKRQEKILELIHDHSVQTQEQLLDQLRQCGFHSTQATVSRDIRELCLVKAATTEGYRYVSSRNESFNPKTQGRFETIFHESVLGVDYAGHVVAWQMPPARFLTRYSGKTLSALFPVMTPS